MRTSRPARAAILAVLVLTTATLVTAALVTAAAEPRQRVAAHAPRDLAIGKVAPEIEGADVDGHKFKLSDYRGKVVVLDFWGDW
jgi:cytochrome oxidase Cu insertion factor (SCO1/SenC/PrrC family)